MDPFDYPKRRKREYCEVKNAVLFLDVVGFSKGTTNEDMKKMIRRLNELIEDQLEDYYYWGEQHHSNNLIVIPTGDGFGIGFHPDFKEEDILDITGNMFEELSKKSSFRVRMGIGEGPNVRYIDKNGMVNLFGYGINLAKRIVDAAAPSQILVGEVFAEELLAKKSVPGLKKLREPREIKHGERIVVFNYYEKGKFGIRAD